MSRVGDLFSIEGKVALVTGGAAGIGEMITRTYLDAGAKVYVASRKREAGEALSAEFGDRCVALQADFSQPDDCGRVGADIMEREGRLDILVNNAGATWGAPYDEFPAKAWDRVFDLNVKGLFLLTQALTPALEAAGSAASPSRVINLGSVNGVSVPEVENYSYAASKAAVHHLTAMLAKHLAPRGITVNAIVPGPFRTKMMAATLDAAESHIVASMPLGRVGEADDIGAAAVYLAAPATRWMTGVLLPVDGGTCTTI